MEEENFNQENAGQEQNQSTEQEESLNSTLEPTEQEAQAEQQAQVKNDKDYNFSRLREEQERLKRERDEYARKLQEYEQKKAAEAEEDDDDLDPYEKKIKDLERKVQEFQTVSASQNTELKLKSEYPDFYNVVNDKNIKALRKQYPEIASTIQSSNDLYTKAVSAYTLIKRLGVNQSEHSEKVNENTSKPRPSSSISPQESNSPLTNANAFSNGLTPELKKQLYRDMVNAAKKY